MIQIEKVKEFFKINPKVYKELKGFLKNLEEGASPEPNPTLLPETFEKGILYEVNVKYTIHLEYFNFVLFDLYKKRLRMEDIRTFQEFTDFKSRVNEEMKTIKDSFSLSSAFDCFLFIYFNQEKGWDFSERVKQYPVQRIRYRTDKVGLSQLRTLAHYCTIKPHYFPMNGAI